MKKHKEKLLKERERLIKSLSRIAHRDPDIEDDWDADYPEGDIEGSEDRAEDAAKLREEYEVRRETEHILEKKLKRVREALERIEEGGYGLCQNCGGRIDKSRLEAAPAARFCSDCKSQ